jgi:hypothetical protein
MDKKSISGMFILDHISETWNKFFGLKILKFFDADPGSGIFLTLDLGSRIWDGKIWIQDPG